MVGMSSMPGTRHFDIALFGSTASVYMLAGCLARNGIGVALFQDRSTEPDTTGEATIPYTSMIFELVADRYQVAEIKDIARTRDIHRQVMPSSGVKKNLGFIYHEPGRAVDMGKALQFNVPSEHGENHLYRPDVDAHLLNAAVRYGATVFSVGTDARIELHDDKGVRVLTRQGQWVAADFLVDGSYRGAALAKALPRMPDEAPLRTASTCLAAHMLDVEPFDACVSSDFPGQWHAGTLHHVFAEGWIGVIPFNNHQHSRNPRVSVLLSINRRMLDPADGDRLLAELIDRYPSLRQHLASARRVGEWQGRAPAQHFHHEPLGRRHLLFDEGAASNDLLFSRKLSNAGELVLALAHRLIDAARQGDYQSTALQAFVGIQNSIVHLNDRITRGAYIAFRDPDLWNAYARVWLLQSIAATITARKINDAFARTRDPHVFDEIDRVTDDGFWMPLYQGYKDILNFALERCHEVEIGNLSSSDAARQIFAQLAAADFVPPIFDFADPDARVYQLTTWRKLKALWWGLVKVPSEVGRLIFYRSFRNPSMRKES
ncbi:NAD(P)/FAD-dependent oxidoreductase [Pseudomonas aeruginosa]|uniref:NAD(P)/FAD-dependent oxidoreductase n=1 Tax=Pseudomonas aeruginosa TaxID=287 RepID=UPI000B5B377B|nr:halogenase [Pseudomonas aeruginosa]